MVEVFFPGKTLNPKFSLTVPRPVQIYREEKHNELTTPACIYHIYRASSCHPAELCDAVFSTIVLQMFPECVVSL